MDAKSEGDLLEQRAAKSSVAIESLKTAFLQSGETDTSEFIIDPQEFDTGVLPQSAVVLNELLGKCQIPKW